MFKYIFTIIIFSFSLSNLKATDIEIRYYNPEATEVIMFWGINDWQPVIPLPAGTTLSGKTMRSVMFKEGNEFVFKVSLPENNVMDFGFNYFKKEGPFKIKVEYWDFNGYPEKKFYHNVVNSNQVIKVVPTLNSSYSSHKIPLIHFAVFYCLLIFIIAIIVFFARKYYFKATAKSFNRKVVFIALSFTLLFFLFVTRAIIAELSFPVLIDPVKSFPALLKIFYDDFLFAALLFLIFGLLFLLLKRFQKTVLIGYAFFIVLFVLIAVLNSKVIEVIGKPFNYQWLYYSDFLKSADASKAINANIEANLYYSCLLMLISIFPLCWLLYHTQLKKPYLLSSIIIIFLIIGLISKSTSTISNLKRVNPVFYFLSSLNASGIAKDNEKYLAAESEFNLKNTDSLPAQYAAAFKSSNIKNVILFVLESTPAEYVTAFNPAIKATPFIDSMKNHAAIFDAAYAHVPSTNKSMFSIFCSSYPDLTFKTVTLEKPDIALPSITSELNKYGYRSSFFNSGDNSYQNAAGFLKNRKIGEVQDYRTNPCSNKVFSDKRYQNKNLDGVDDSCLSVRFFNWLGNDTEKPFFSMMWTFQTHYPYFTNGKQIDYGVDNPSLNKYLNALHRADETLQQMVDGLKQRGLLESTLIVILGDHGEAFGRHGQTTHAAGIYEENLHIPLLFYNPVLFKGERFSYPVGISDLAPGIFSVLQKPAPEIWQGENVFSVNRRKRVYFLSPYSDILFGFREDNYKFILNASENSMALYDLKTDPFETTDISKSKPEYVKNANKQIQSWIQYQRIFLSRFMDTNSK